MSKLLAPNGKPSNLTPEQYKLVRSKEFISWFGDWEKDPANASKVLDENGEPLVVYRGFNKKSDKGNVFKFGVNRFKNNRLANRFGHYFTNSKEVAKEYSEQGDKINDEDIIIKAYFLNIKNLLNITETNPKFPSFEEWKKIRIRGMQYSNYELIERLKLREFPTYSYLFSGLKVKDEDDIDELSEALISKLKVKIKEDESRDKEIYETYEYISLNNLIKLISNKKIDVDDVLSEYEYNQEEAKTNMEVYYWFINHKKNDKYVTDDLDIILKDLIIKNDFDGGVYREWQFGVIRGKTDLVYFTFESNQIKLADGTNTTFDVSNPDIRFNEGGEIDEYAQQLIDIISSNPQLEKYQKYKVILKDKFGIDFDSIYKDQEYIDNANINDIKKQDDFFDFDNWLKYAKIISKKRGFIPMDLYDVPSDKYKLTDEIWNETSKNLNFNVKKIPYIERGTDGGDIARAFADTIYYTDQADFYYFLHELGHIYDFQNNIKGIIKNPAYSPTNYGTNNSGETFAENFAIYFINPMALKNWNEDVYNSLDSQINTKYKNEISRIMPNNNNITFNNGGEVNTGLFSQIWEWFGIKF